MCVNSKQLICNCIIPTATAFDYADVAKWGVKVAPVFFAAWRSSRRLGVNIRRTRRKNRDNGFSILVLPLERGMPVPTHRIVAPSFPRARIASLARILLALPAASRLSSRSFPFTLALTAPRKEALNFRALDNSVRIKRRSSRNARGEGERVYTLTLSSWGNPLGANAKGDAKS